MASCNEIVEKCFKCLHKKVCHSFGYGCKDWADFKNEANYTEVGTCEGCKNIAFRYPYVSMYPCASCVRANKKDYYKENK